jgi:DNA-binding response OmpR family regulator
MTSSILVVEDDPHTGATLAAWLRKHDYHVCVAPNGAAGLIAAHVDTPALIIMDLVMPILEGQQAITALRRDPATANIPIIVLSVRADDRSLSDALAAGANIYLIKPPDPQELLSVVARLLVGEADPATR